MRSVTSFRAQCNTAVVALWTHFGVRRAEGRCQIPWARPGLGRRIRRFILLLRPLVQPTLALTVA